jgi:hypothetical protein
MESSPMSVLSHQIAEPQIQPRIDIVSYRHIDCAALNASIIVFTAAVCRQEKGKMNLRDAILTIPWIRLLAATMPLLALAAARFRPIAIAGSSLGAAQAMPVTVLSTRRT